jgi:hypothetical protein
VTAVRREIEEVIAEAEETAARMRRMVIRLTDYTDRLAAMQAAADRDDRDE